MRFVLSSSFGIESRLSPNRLEVGLLSLNERTPTHVALQQVVRCFGRSRAIELSRNTPHRSDGKSRGVSRIGRFRARSVLVTLARFIKQTATVAYAPNLPSRPALAKAKVMRCFASNWLRPPWRESLSLNPSQRSGRQQSETSSVGTGCQLWLLR